MNTETNTTSDEPRLVAVCISGGGIPKRPVPRAEVAAAGIVGDGHAHEKHLRADRAISLLDIETLRELVAEGFGLVPGATGENLTLENVGVQGMPPGTLLQIGNVILRLEQPRKPCYVLDAIDPRLKEAIVRRCGYMASVLRGGTLQPGMTVCSADWRASCSSARAWPSAVGKPDRFFAVDADSIRSRLAPGR